jgi:hypothetical protein
MARHLSGGESQKDIFYIFFFSPWRDTSVEENLKKFEKMRTGQYEEGTAFLRMKV